ncbi:MAG: tripartite tricarboxylate transporter substrate binding protein [Betaproteobacteria bacterium]|nr:tripartite tricarboxylate transporter substrate binding protein [Betaproteobacteria bacterium]
MRFMLALAAALGLFAAGFAAAQKWPEKPIRLVVPYPPGGNVDTAARIVAPGMQEALGQPVIIDNKAGAGGMIAGEHVAKSPADGYTLFFTANSPLLHAPIIFNRPAYQWDKDFVAVSSVSFTPIALLVHPTVSAKTLKELLELARKEPGKLTLATPSAGTTNHLLSELLQSLAGVSWLTVHYKGNAPASTAMLGGEVQVSFEQVSVSLPFIKQGRVRALAVTTDQRVSSLPEVPTFEEAGVRGMEGATFTGIVAPAGTAEAVVVRLHGALAKVLADKIVIDKFDALGAQARATTPEQFNAYLKAEYEKWTPVIKKANIKAN